MTVKQKEKLIHILLNYFRRKYPPLNHLEQRKIAYSEYAVLEQSTRAKKSSALGKIERALAGSFPVEIDACGAKKDDQDHILFFNFSFRLEEHIFWGVLELSDDGVCISEFDVSNGLEKSNFSLLDEVYLDQFADWLNLK
jgi:hypothetical protein